jgi:hypothetical protein
MSESDEVAAIYDLPKHIWVARDVLDTNLETGSGPLCFNVLTPVPVPGQPLLDIVSPPRLPGVPSDNKLLADRPWVIDYAAEADEQSIALSRVAFVASGENNRDVPNHRLAKDDLRTGIAYHFRDQVDGWFDALRSWIEVLTQQDLNHRHPSYDVEFPAAGLFVWSDDQFKGPGQVKLNWPQFRPISLPAWTWALGQVAAGNRPATEHLLMRDARAALARGDTRRAVLDAATAVEIVLSSELARANENRPPGKTAQLKGPQTLGRLAKFVPQLRPNLAASEAELRELTSARNGAAHRVDIATPSSANRILRIGDRLVKTHSNHDSPATAQLTTGRED